MELTKERKILAAVVGIGAFALVFDRVVLDAGQTDPADAAAAAALAPVEPQALKPTETPVAAADAGSAAVVVPTNRDTVADRLARYASERQMDPMQTPEAFAPSPVWVPRGATAPAVAPGMKGGGEADPVAVLRQFAAEHRLNAVMGGQRSGAAGVAIVDGTAVRVGERVGEFSLLEVRERSAVFAGEAGRVELRLASE